MIVTMAPRITEIQAGTLNTASSNRSTTTGTSATSVLPSTLCVGLRTWVNPTLCTGSRTWENAIVGLPHVVVLRVYLRNDLRVKQCGKQWFSVWHSAQRGYRPTSAAN